MEGGKAGTGLHGRAGAALPGVDELRRRYTMFRSRYFDNEVPPVDDVVIEWSRRLVSSAGRCYPRQRIIRLSTHYHRNHPDDVDKTLLHEMIHLLVPNHGPEFYAWMERIRRRGGAVERYAKERATPIVHRWEYTCDGGCGTAAKRQRRLAHGGLHHRCKRCGATLTERRLV